MSGPPFVVLHVCMGNICRSPMAERLLAHEVRRRLGDRATEYVHSESAGTGGWHEGDPMNPPAAGELRRRGVAGDGFRARRLLGAHLDTADLILTATAEQLRFVTGLRPDAHHRAFVLGQFGRLLRTAAPNGFDGTTTPGGVHARGVALATAVDAARAGGGPERADDLDDPWGRGDAYFERTADRIAATIGALVAALLPQPTEPG